jgi:predicted nucleic acid-binding protein
MDLLDTDVLIDVQRRHPAALTWFNSLSTVPAVPGFVVMELIQDARNAGEVAAALKLVAPLNIVWPTEIDCASALANFSAFHLSHGLGLLDALIASWAVGLNATLCTFNKKHFGVVPRLVTSQPYVR